MITSSVTKTCQKKVTSKTELIRGPPDMRDTSRSYAAGAVVSQPIR